MVLIASSFMATLSIWFVSENLEFLLRYVVFPLLSRLSIAFIINLFRYILPCFIYLLKRCLRFIQSIHGTIYQALRYLGTKLSIGFWYVIYIPGVAIRACYTFVLLALSTLGTYFRRLGLLGAELWTGFKGILSGVFGIISRVSQEFSAKVSTNYDHTVSTIKESCHYLISIPKAILQSLYGAFNSDDRNNPTGQVTVKPDGEVIPNISRDNSSSPSMLTDIISHSISIFQACYEYGITLPLTILSSIFSTIGVHILYALMIGIVVISIYWKYESLVTMLVPSIIESWFRLKMILEPLYNQNEASLRMIFWAYATSLGLRFRVRPGLAIPTGPRQQALPLYIIRDLYSRFYQYVRDSLRGCWYALRERFQEFYTNCLALFHYVNITIRRSFGRNLRRIRREFRRTLPRPVYSFISRVSQRLYNHGGNLYQSIFTSWRAWSILGIQLLLSGILLMVLSLGGFRLLPVVYNYVTSLVGKLKAQESSATAGPVWSKQMFVDLFSVPPAMLLGCMVALRMFDRIGRLIIRNWCGQVSQVSFDLLVVTFSPLLFSFCFAAYSLAYDWSTIPDFEYRYPWTPVSFATVVVIIIDGRAQFLIDLRRRYEAFNEMNNRLRDSTDPIHNSQNASWFAQISYVFARGAFELISRFFPMNPPPPGTPAT